MKILYVTALMETINAFLVPHIEMLLEEGNSVECACNINTTVDENLINKNVKINNIYFSRNPLKINYKKVINQLIKLQEKNNYDIVHVHTPIAAFLTRFAFRKYDCKIIYTAHGFHFYKGAPILNWFLYYNLEKMAARWTDVLVTINSEDFDRATKFKLRNNGQVKFMHGVGIERKVLNVLSKREIVEYRESLGLKEDDFVLLILADINKNKNHIQVIKAMKILTKKYSNIKIICAGKGELLDKLKNIVEDNSLEDNIKFIGYRNDVYELIQCSDCIGLFSKREGLGKCLLEGMNMNKALIATNTRGPRELIDYGKNGYLVKLGDYKQTAYLIEKLYLNRDKLYKFGEHSKNKIEKYYLDNVLLEIENFY
ncbi:putative glycosyltransferase EpsD [Clostridium perfringens]|uniref:glycosyltransferase family 4 protein n=1 Tax=Clostridium perfringens TaxID=1502 RepID=UPI00244380AB|nr:glycosyltransferase family 4 protein [Clostridium perfringens]MDG6887085.1 putative glycosyltransferase EpsD [Clostridium perfringens]MDK0767707.1 glycosyltransferase family 4 protein [Clostridium perfringens]MDK0770354.1 glycosyltransferase family 4 protein [Clostridium perfringens]MDK0775500.1 glycosyltransferase family 4 protein [Clostridium perfringens]MDM1016889.1 glycosyltransferase family 4 protein [Clostridium perfringens]